MTQDPDFDEETQSQKENSDTEENKQGDTNSSESSKYINVGDADTIIQAETVNINADQKVLEKALEKTLYPLTKDISKLLSLLPEFHEIYEILKTVDDKKKEEEHNKKDLPENEIAWFQEQNLEVQAFIISLLFFSDSSIQFLEKMSNEIVDLINKGKKSDSKEQQSSIFDQRFSVQALIDEGIIKIVNTNIETDAGILKSDVVTFANTSFFEKILEIILNNHDLIRLHPLLQTWLIKQINKSDESLYSIGTFDTESIRIQSAYGLGLLARKSFTNVFMSTVDVWGNAESPYTRLLVGWIFLGYYQKEKAKEYWETISSLLSKWVSSDNYFKRWTSIASTTRLGLIYSEEDDTSLNVSLSIYKEISKLSNSNHFKGVLSKCIRFLFSLSPYHARIICNELASWIKKDDGLGKVSLIASELFIEIVNVKIKLNNSNSENEISLWELCESESYVLSDSVAQLIRESFLHPRGRFVDRAIDELRLSIDEFLSNDLVQHKALSNILKQVNADKSLHKYMSLAIDKKYSFLLIS